MRGTSVPWGSWAFTVVFGTGLVGCADEGSGSDDAESSSTEFGTADAGAAEADAAEAGDDESRGETGSATTSGTMADDTNADGSTEGAADGSTGDWPEIDLPPLSDDFDDGDIEGWTLFQPQFADVSVQDGQLVVVPSDMSLWFNAVSASHLHKEVPGNFKVTSLVTARSAADPNAPPSPQFRLGGLMARDGSATSENYVFIVVGADGNDVSVETKTTQNSQSQFQGPPWPDGRGELRICRLGSTFHLLIREPGGSWTLQETYERPDLPPTLQVGPVAYANSTPADLVVTYASVDFDNVESEADCMQ